MKLPRFNLRDLFWLVLVVGMGCAWWMERWTTDWQARIGTLVVVAVLIGFGVLLGRQLRTRPSW